jgi:NAD(P)H dehydrogenase (quinone)
LTKYYALAGKIMGRPVSRTVISDEDMRGNAQNAGVPAAVISVMIGFYLAARAGEFSEVDPTLANILGRAPRTVQGYMATKLG